MSVRVSIIVAAFNAEKYLRQCVGSLLNQTLRDIEIIIINDGSTDETLSIIESYLNADFRIKLINQENRGVGSSRNAGIIAAKGEWIGFVDADDWAEPTMFETLLTEVEFTNADFAICNVNGTENGIVVNTRLKLEPGLIDFTEKKVFRLRQFLQFKYDNANWNKLYKSDIITQNKILFNEKMTIWEDLLFNLHYIQFIKKGVIIDKNLYNYRFHQDSVMRSGKVDLISQLNLFYENFIEFAVKQNLPKIKEEFREQITGICYSSCIYWALKKNKQSSGNFFQLNIDFTRDLKRINSGIYTYKNSTAEGIRGFREKLLYRKKIRIFAFLVIVKSYFS